PPAAGRPGLPAHDDATRVMRGRRRGRR
ncbi:hypothetical protein BMAJHU_B0712, partial [Burkholderia mallei JHU]